MKLRVCQDAQDGFKISLYLQDGHPIRGQMCSDAQAAPLGEYIVWGAGPDLSRRHLVPDLSGAAVRIAISMAPIPM